MVEILTKTCISTQSETLELNYAFLLLEAFLGKFTENFSF